MPACIFRTAPFTTDIIGFIIIIIILIIIDVVLVVVVIVTIARRKMREWYPIQSSWGHNMGGSLFGSSRARICCIGALNGIIVAVIVIILMFSTRWVVCDIVGRC